MLVDYFGAALGYCLETYSEVDDTDCRSIVDGYSLDLQNMRSPGQAVLLVLLKGILDFDCREEEKVSLGVWIQSGEREGSMSLRPIGRVCMPESSA